jgi:hypothetical protein
LTRTEPFSHIHRNGQASAKISNVGRSGINRCFGISRANGFIRTPNVIRHVHLACSELNNNTAPQVTLQFSSKLRKLRKVPIPFPIIREHIAQLPPFKGTVHRDTKSAAVGTQSQSRIRHHQEQHKSLMKNRLKTDKKPFSNKIRTTTEAPTRGSLFPRHTSLLRTSVTSESSVDMQLCRFLCLGGG